MNAVVFAVIGLIALTLFLAVIIRRDRGQKEVTKDWWKWQGGPDGRQGESGSSPRASRCIKLGVSGWESISFPSS
jgi:hypothetical protein